MAFFSAGNPTPNRITFNSATIDFGNQRMVQIDTATLSTDATTLYLYTLGSIIGQALVRHSAKFTLTGKIKSFDAEIENLAYGASSAGSPQGITFLDGQPTFTNPVVTFFDINNAKQYQVQFQNAMWKSDKMTFKAADYGEWDFELDSLNLLILYTN